MGWLDRASAAARIAADKAEKLAREVADELEAEYGDDERYQDTKSALRTFKDKAVAAGQEARIVGRETVDEFSRTETGQAIGVHTRKLGSVVAELPALSAVADLAQHRHGVPALAEMYKQSPKDPERAIWLAEALLSVQRDMRLYGRVRSLTSPTYAVMSQSVKAAGKLGMDGADPTAVRVLKVAFVEARKRARANPQDARSLHILARVYLAQAQPSLAGRFAKLAILADPADGLPWITLSRAYLDLNQTENAKRAAQRAVDAGAGFGNEWLARATIKSKQRTEADVDRYERLRANYTPQQEAAYKGVAIRSSEAVTGATDQQYIKLARLVGIKED